MSKFNKVLSKPLSANGNPQYAKSEKEQLYELVVNTLYGRDTFYETTDEKAVRLHSLVNTLVNKSELDFLANLAVYARYDMNMRNMPIMLVDAFIKSLKAKTTEFAGTRLLVKEVVGRVDQITDLLALLGDKTKIPMALKRGLSDAFNKFNEYQFAKYNRKGKVTLKDAMRIIHPVPKDEDTSALFSRIMTDTLATPDTWEVQLSKHGNTKEVWEGLIERKVLGYQATLKNLRNMICADISVKAQRQVADYIVSNALRSKSLPFEFLAAMEAIEELDNIIFSNAIIDAMDATICNVPSLGDKVLVMLDTSGSMFFDRGLAVKNSSFLSAVLATASKNSEKFSLVRFASEATFTHVNTGEKVYSTYRNLIKNAGTGGSTNFEAALAIVNHKNYDYDTVIVLTDNEIDDFRCLNTITTFQPKATKIVINCAASQTSIAPPAKGWHMLAGWSPNMFKYLDALREGESVVKMLSRPFTGRCSSTQLNSSNLPKPSEF